MKWLPSLILLLLSNTSYAKQFIGGCQINSENELWQKYKNQFIKHNGRVIDNGNGNISHSESQGYGMLISAFFNDHETFKRIWNWTETTIKRKNDGLFSWKWQPQAPHIPDKNNASDGDIFIAWSLLRADKKWPGHKYAESATNIINMLSKTVIYDIDQQSILLPARHGFKHDYKIIINPSYWVFPAFNDFRKIDKKWEKVNQSAFKILNSSQFGDYKLPSDWIDYRNNQWIPSSTFPARFSYASYRIPLYLIWGGYHNSVNDHYLDWIINYNKAWVNIKTNQMANYKAPNGANAVATLVQLSNEKYKHRHALPLLSQNDDYYSASLVVLSHIAFYERYCQ